MSDTIDAIIPQALVVEVHDSTGALAPAGTVVRFTAVPGPEFPGSEIRVQMSTTTAFSSFATATTDQAGTVGMIVRFGSIAGVGRLAVSVPTLGLEDTARFTVKAGNADRLVIFPVDTSLYVGKSYTWGGNAFDRYGNLRLDPVAWSTTASGITVSNAGVVTATAEGVYTLRGDVVPALATGSRTALVRVVPRGRFVVASSIAGGIGIVAVDADGSNLTTLATVNAGGLPVHPAWIPGTNMVVYTAPTNGRQVLFTVGTDAVPKPFFSTAAPTLGNQAEPTPSADGKWLFFSVSDTQCPQDPQYGYCIARSRIDGSDYQLLEAGESRQPAPSPDGTKVAFYSPVWQAIRVLDIVTNTVSSWSVAGSNPAWSPDGTRIAYRNIQAGLSIMNPDGTGQRVVSISTTSNVFSWSPDSRWVIAQQNGGSVLIDAATGAVLPLHYSSIDGVPESMK